MEKVGDKPGIEPVGCDYKRLIKRIYYTETEKPLRELPSGHISKKNPALHDCSKFLQPYPKGSDAGFSF
jgi:hypothetical protein